MEKIKHFQTISYLKFTATTEAAAIGTKKRNRDLTKTKKKCNEIHASIW